MTLKASIARALLISIGVPSPLFAADQWMVRRESSSGACHVQVKTASPLGADLAGPFDARKAACLKSKDRFDPDATDPNKCFTYGQGTVDGCKKEGVILPGTKNAHSPKS